MSKKYFFRDLDNNANLMQFGSYHAAGLVHHIDKSLSGGKDIVVIFINPFTGIVYNSWRSYDEVELFEVPEEQYCLMKDFLNKADQLT